MNDFILDEEMIDALLIGLLIARKATDETIASGTLQETDIADLDGYIERWEQLADMFGDLTDEQGETVH